MGDKEIKILCYADDVLIAENEDHLQRFLYQFYKTAKKFKMTLSTAKTKCMTTSKIQMIKNVVARNTAK